MGGNRIVKKPFRLAVCFAGGNNLLMSWLPLLPQVITQSGRKGIFGGIATMEHRRLTNQVPSGKAAVGSRSTVKSLAHLLMMTMRQTRTCVVLGGILRLLRQHRRRKSLPRKLNAMAHAGDFFQLHAAMAFRSITRLIKQTTRPLRFSAQNRNNPFHIR